MPWQAKLGCAEHYYLVVEQIVNFLPPAWLLLPQTGKVFNNLEHCKHYLCGYSFAEGFDIVHKGRRSKGNPSLCFLCFYYRITIQNIHRLKDKVEKNIDNNITSRHQQDNTTIGQLNYI